MDNQKLSRETLEEASGFSMPKMKDIRAMLRYNPHASCREKVLDAFVIGSTSKLTRKADSDLDIAVFIPAKKRVSSIKFTERYHEKFMREQDVPRWQGVKVDFQFYYESDRAEIESYPRMDCSE